MMAQGRAPGTVYWIDHYVVPVTDLDRWIAFYANVLGAEARAPGDAGSGQRSPTNGAPGPPEEEPGQPDVLFTWVGPCHIGASASNRALPPSRGFGVDCPRYSYYVRPADLDDHLRRLDEYRVPHLDPVRSAEAGELGTAIRFEDPDGNQMEFWAPASLPEGAMERETPVKVGRIAAATFESRDLTKTLDFYYQFCGLEPALGDDIPRETMVFPLAAGGRLIFTRTDELGLRTGGHTLYPALHSALVVRDDQFMPLLKQMYQSLPEWDYEPDQSTRLSPEEAECLPARTGSHGNPLGPEWKRTFGRGDSFYDWDTNAYHFVPRAPVDGSMVTPKHVSQRRYLEGR